MFTGPLNRGMSDRSSLWEGSKRSVSNAGFELVLSEMRVR